MAEIPELDSVRQLIVDRVPNLKEISLAIGMNETYLQQFVRRGTPVEFLSACASG
jgi:hypothetical protein